MRHSAWFFLLVFLLFSVSARGQGVLLKNGGFEGGAGVSVPDWQPFESGYDVDRQTKRGGEQSIRCDNATTATKRGAQATIALNQKVAAPVVVTGWSRADAVSGVKNSDYSLYADVEYADGTPQWGYFTPFRTGTRDWESRRLAIFPQKPIRTIRVYALFRGHSGTAWFDDFYARELSGPDLFDSQRIAPPPKHAGKGPNLPIAARDGLGLTLSAQGDIVGVQSGGQAVTSNAAGGFFARDVSDDGAVLPLRGAVSKLKAGGLEISGANSDLRLRYTLKITRERDSLAIDGEITDINRDNRALTLYFALPIDATGWQWGNDVRSSETIAPNREYTNQTRINVGATGGLSRYPFAAISNETQGVGIGSQQDWPSVYRIFYNGAVKQFVMAWDFSLSKTLTWPAYNARFRCNLFRLPPALAKWGFRAVAQTFYALHPEGFTRRAPSDGIWLPFTAPDTIEHSEDFGFSYHEGDNSLLYDDQHKISSFRYTEPATYWLPMPPEMPRTYENALALITKNAGQGTGSREQGTENTGAGENPKSKTQKEPTPDLRPPTPAEFARAVLNSGTWDEDGKFNLEFRNEPWTNGAVFPLNPNPELLATPGKPTKGSLSYNFDLAAQRYGPTAKGIQDGEFLDSLEGWADTLDYRPSNLQSIPYPLPFDTESRRPVAPEWYAVHTFVRFLRDDLRNRNKLLFANSVPIRFSIFAPLLDVMGIEVNWLDAQGNWSPEDDATLNYRRTLSARKPYLLLMNTDFNKFTSEYVERYFQRCLFYGMFPSMFSANAADHAYWETPAWYNRDRPLFKKYIPLLKIVSAAGWEPVTYARSANPAVFIERFGTHFFTLRNDRSTPQTAKITLDAAALGLKAPLRVRSLLTGKDIAAELNSGTLRPELGSG